MTLLNVSNNPARDPILALLSGDDGAVLALIAGVEGPSYRPVGAMMSVFTETERAGTLSSGCVEADISLHALAAREAGKPNLVRYGRGSPFADIQLPCGGGLDILLLPDPDRAVLQKVADARAARRACTLQTDVRTGAMALADSGPTGLDGAVMQVRFEPDIRFLVFGKGPEASTFASLVQSAGYPNMLLSPDEETLEDAAQAGCETRHLVSQEFPGDVAVDEWTAIVLFFHDHEWEPPILTAALKTPAFYIGAQGSQRARDLRFAEMVALGAPTAELARLRGPIGLIPSARDAGTLTVSVLAEVLAATMDKKAAP